MTGGDVLADRYLLGALLGQGGMGYVHEALDLKLQREVAVKLLGAASPDGDSLRRFSREALAAGSLQHPNVVGVFDTGEQHGRPFLVTELLRGETLRQVLRRGPVQLEQARAWAKQLAAGLAAAHDKGLTHRDLKPSNIFITSDGWVKILDFGLVKLAESLPHDQDAHRVVGTVGYMAPEQVRGQPVDARADLFNFGLVLYEMLCGEPAFADGLGTDTSYAIVVGAPKPLPAGVPRDLHALVGRCLAKDREKRPASAREILRLLEPGAAMAPSRWRRWALPAAALLILAAALGTLALRRPQALAPGPLAGSIAVFEFDTRAIEQHDPLTEGLNDLLIRDLVVSDLHTILVAGGHRTAAGGDSDQRILERARAAALKLGAKYFVLGRVDQRGGELLVSAALHDTSSARTLSHASVHGTRTEIWRLIRQLSDQLQRKKPSPAEFEASVASFQDRTTASLPALMAWLEGWRLMFGNHDADAAAAMDRAYTIDPDFTLALYEQSRVNILFDLDAAESGLARAMRHPERLSFAERAHAQNYLLRLRGDLREAAQVLRDAANEHPDDAEIWQFIANSVFHRGAFLGQSPREAISALQRSLELDPVNEGMMLHLSELAQLRGEREVVLRFSERLISFTDNGRLETLDDRFSRAWATNDTVEHERLMAELRANPRGLSAYDVQGIVIRLELQMDGSADPREVAAMLPPDSGPRSHRRTHPGFTPLAHTDLVRGHIRDARREMAQAISSEPAGDLAFYLPWIDTLELIHATPAELGASRAAAARLDVSADPTRAPGKQHLIGLLALRAGDLPAAREALRALRAMPEVPRSSIAADLALSLQARILAAQGDPKGALAVFDQQKLHVPERYFRFYGRARENFFRAGLLVALGRPREALPLYEALTAHDMVDPVFYPAWQLYSARIYDSLGETEKALFGYERFTAMWHDCDPEEQPEVARAQARLLQLRQTR